MFHILCTAKQPRIRLKRLLGLAISATVLFIVIFHLCSSPEGTSDATAAEYVNQHHPVIRSPVHSLLHTENYSIANSSAQYRIRLDADHPGCPIPRPALVGILTTPGLESSFRRQYLREKYRELNKKLDVTKRIDVKFFFGTSNNTEIMHQLNAEYAAHPDDTIITSRMEGRDEGKILDFFQYARSILYTQHPSNRHRFCKRYLYVAKSDDDSVIHIPRLSELLLSLPAPTSSSSSSNFVGNVFHDVITQARIQISGMHGMLYLMSADLVEWINFSPIPVENVRGVEDQQVGYWFQLSKLHINWFYVGRNRFHDLMDVNPITRWFQHRITSETVVVHYCKTLQDFFRCMSGLLEEIHVNHSLFKAENAQHRLKENGLHLPLPTIKESLQHMRDFYFTSNSTMLPLAEFDHHLLHHSITVHTGVQFTDLEMSVVMREFVNMGRRGKWIETQQELRKFLWNYVVGARAKDVGVVCDEKCVKQVALGFARRAGDVGGVVVGQEDLVRRIVVNSLRLRVGGEREEDYVESFMKTIERVGLEYRNVDLKSCLEEFERLEQLEWNSQEERGEWFTRFVVESAVIKMADRVGIMNMTEEFVQYAVDIMVQFVPFSEFEQEVVEFFVVQESSAVGINLTTEQMVERTNVASDILATRTLMPDELKLISVWVKVLERGRLMGREWCQEDVERIARALKVRSKAEKLSDEVVDLYSIRQIVQERGKVLGVKLSSTKTDDIVIYLQMRLKDSPGDASKLWVALDEILKS